MQVATNEKREDRVVLVPRAVGVIGESECWSPILPEETNEERVGCWCHVAVQLDEHSLSITSPTRQSGPSSSSLIGPVMPSRTGKPILAGIGVTSPGTSCSAVRMYMCACVCICVVFAHAILAHSTFKFFVYTCFLILIFLRYTLVVLIVYFFKLLF